MPQTAYCSECKSRVQLTPDGLCPNGHGRPALRNIESAEDPAASHDAPLTNKVNSPRTGKSPSTRRKLTWTARLLAFASLVSCILAYAVKSSFSDMSYQVDTIIEPIASALLYSVPIFLIAAAVLAVIASEASHAKISFLAALIVAAALTFWAGTLIDQNLYGVVATATIVSLTPAIAADNRASRTGSIVASLALMAAELLLVPSANMDDLGSIVPALLLLPPLGAQCVMGVAGIGATLSQRASG